MTRKIIPHILSFLAVAATVALVPFPVSSADDKPGEYFSAALSRGLEVSDDPTYGYTPENPVKIGGGYENHLGHALRSLYLDILRGPKGKKVKYKRLGIGGMYEKPDAPLGYAVIDEFEIRSKGLGGPRRLYITILDYEDVKIPQGLSIDEKYVAEMLERVKAQYEAEHPGCEFPPK